MSEAFAIANLHRGELSKDRLLKTLPIGAYMDSNKYKKLLKRTVVPVFFDDELDLDKPKITNRTGAYAFAHQTGARVQIGKQGAINGTRVT